MEQQELESKSNPPKITMLYGFSDDAVYLRGAIHRDYVNFSLAQRGIGFEASDGTKGVIVYDGQWKITVDEKGLQFHELILAVGNLSRHKRIAIKATPYSDVLLFKEGLMWIKINGKKNENCIVNGKK